MNQRYRQTIASVAVVCLVLSTAPVIPALAVGTMDLKGNGRVETAIKIAETIWNATWSGSRTAILASGKDENLVDALAIVPLSYAQKAPILLSRDNKDAVDAATLKEIKDRNVEKVYLAAGNGVLSEKIEIELRSVGVQEIVRLGGGNRYETAKNINRELGSVRKVAVVNGEVGLADALSIASIAAKQGMAIVMTSSKDAVPDMDLRDKTVYAIGGNSVISDAVVSQMNATRLGGNNRYETNASVMDGIRADVNFDTVYLADGNDAHLVDALTGAVLAAQTASPIVLTDNSLGIVQKEVLQNNLSKNSKIEVFGGTGDSPVTSAINSIINASEERKALAVDSVIPLNLKQVKILFNKVITEESSREAIEDSSNYTLKEKDGYEINAVVKDVKLDEGKKFAVLTFKDKPNYKENAYIIEEQVRYIVTIDDTITGKEWTSEFTFRDSEVPKVEKVEVVGVDTIKVRFSEPIKPDNLSEINRDDNTIPILSKENFEINEGNLYIDRVELVNDSREANIILQSNLGYNRDVVVKIKNSIEDYSGLNTVEEKTTARVEEDKRAPRVVGYRNVSEDHVTLLFDKDVKFRDTDTNRIDASYRSSDLQKIYNTNENYTAKSIQVEGREVTITFGSGDEISKGSTDIYIKSNLLESRFEIGNDSISQKIQRGSASTGLELESVEQNSNSNCKIDIKYSQKVKLGSSTRGSAENSNNYVLKDSSGNEWSIHSIVEQRNDKEFIITTSRDLDKSRNYTLTVKNIEEQNGSSMKQNSKSFTARDRESSASHSNNKDRVRE